MFFSKKSTFLLFKVDPDFATSEFKHNVKINMYKNLESSKFCETFIKLHNYRKDTLDISNQFDKIKDEYTSDISFILNETIILSKVHLHDKDIYDTLNIYGFTMTSYNNEFAFIITERHNILKRLGKKIVRTSGIQISTTPALNLLDEFHQESKLYGKAGSETRRPTDEIIKFSDAEKEAILNDPTER